MIYSSLYNHAQEFVKNCKFSDIEQDVVDAIVVEYINAIAVYNNLNKFMHTDELRCPVKFCNGTPNREERYKRLLNDVKEKMSVRCISYCINEHIDYNNCNGKCSVSNNTAMKVIDMYISTYLGEKVT